MPTYGDVIYNITSMYVAPLALDNTYGTPAYIEYGQELSWEYESDNDEIMAYGLITESLAIAKKATGTFKQAVLDIASFTIMTGLSESTSGTTPNQISTTDILVGGAGNPYFGIIAAFASPGGANVIAGFPKAQLATIPGFKIEQNKFRVSEVSINMFAPSTAIRKVARYLKYETAAEIPDEDSEFDTFFAGMFS